MPQSTNQGVTAAPGAGVTGGAMAGAVRDGARPGYFGSVAVKIARIGDGSPLDITPIPVAFTQDLHDTLGDYGTDNDGWEQLLGDMEFTIGDDATGIVDTNADLINIGDTDNAGFEANVWNPLLEEHAAFTYNHQQLVDKLGNDSNINSGPPTPPPPTPPPPPPTGGGGGGTGGGPPPPPPPPDPCEGTGANVDGSDQCFRF